MEHTIKAHLSIILEKCLKFTGVRLDSRLPPLTSKTFDVSTLSPLLSCILAIFDCSKFPYFLNAKSVAYSSIPENEKEINIFSILTIFSKTFNFGSILAHQSSKLEFIGCWRIFWHPDPCGRNNSGKKYNSVQTATVQQYQKTYQLLLESAYQPSILQCS